MKLINNNKNKLKTLINFNYQSLPKHTLNKLQVCQKKKKKLCELLNNVFSKKDFFKNFYLKATK